jgi:hypothetical protein
VRVSGSVTHCSGESHGGYGLHGFSGAKERERNRVLEEKGSWIVRPGKGSVKEWS